MLNKNTCSWVVKKVWGHEEPATKSSYTTKSFYIWCQTFTSKAHSNFQGASSTIISFVTLGHLFCMIPYKQKVAKGDKANHGWENTL